jgi:hypothetical protein
MPRRLIFALLAVLGAASGCSSTISVRPEQALPRSLLVPLPVTVGLVIDDELRSFRQDETRGGVNWKVDLGPGHERLMREVFAASFRDVRVFDSVEAARGQPGLAAVFEPGIEQYSFATARDTGAGYWAVTLRYRMSIHAPEGGAVDTLALSGYGSGIAKGGEAKSLERATVAAMRDAAAKFLVQFPQQAVAAPLRDGRPLRPRTAGALPAEDMEMVPVEPDTQG